jgi:hypothetical protein
MDTERSTQNDESRASPALPEWLALPEGFVI